MKEDQDKLLFIAGTILSGMYACGYAINSIGSKVSSPDAMTDLAVHSATMLVEKIKLKCNQ